MKVHFLGGADEVGASCVLVEAAGRRILVDAGVRMGSGRRDPLPDLALATELGGLDAVLVTHAHLDHSGALPLVHGAFPAATVWMTEPTLALIRILLLDALKIMELKADQEGEIPLYPKPAVEALLGAARTAAPLEPVSLCDGAVQATFFPAGHVLGAAAVGLQTAEGNVLISGDISVADQLTVPGMPRPRFAADAVVSESTYGGRLHASRRAEEERLAQRVLDVLHEGGKVLIPAFALGRAQEVLLVLRRALARADAPANVPVYADGMVRAICGVYSAHADYLTPTLRARAEAGRGLFYTADGRVQPVGSPAQRQAILDGGPCVIVASSGMLSGGPSTLYAAGLVGGEHNLIAITGYQDEEAPGRRLQEVASGQRDELWLDGRAHTVRCRVETYGLSAHADEGEIAALVGSVGPRRVMLVHGDRGAREALARRLMDQGDAEVHLPASGDTVEVTRGRKVRSRVTAGMGRGRPLDSAGLVELHLRLMQRQARGRTYSAADLAEQWYGSGSVPLDIGPVRQLVADAPSLFVADRKRPFLYRCVAPGSGLAEPHRPTAPSGPARDEDGRLEQNAALALADELLPTEAGLYRKGALRDQWTLRLAFCFPQVARKRYAEAIDRLADQSGWAVEVHPEPHAASLEEEARRVVEPTARVTRAASIHHDDQTVHLTVDRLVDAQTARGLSDELAGRTGYALELKRELVGGTAPARQAFDDSGRMEINLAFATVDRAFAAHPHRPDKKSKKRDGDGEFIELSFLSPEVGRRYQDTVDELCRTTGWRLRVGARVDQQAVLTAARALVPDSWRHTKGPGLDLGGRKVLLRLSNPPPPDELETASAELQRQTGFSLVVK